MSNLEWIGLLALATLISSLLGYLIFRVRAKYIHIEHFLVKSPEHEPYAYEAKRYGCVSLLATVLGALFFIAALTNFAVFVYQAGPWGDATIGVWIGTLIPILISLGNFLIQHNRQVKVKDIFSKIASQLDKWLAFFVQRVAQTTTFGARTIGRVILFVSNTVVRLWKLATIPFKWLLASIKSPKWYKEKGAVDSGLIEVSLAVTAIVIALPALSSNDLLGYGWFRIISVALPTMVSLSLIDIHAKDKGSSSPFVLLSPFGDGPFFFLAWAIVLGALYAIMVFASSGR